METRTGSVSPEDFIRYAEEAAKSDLSARLEIARKRWESGERSLELVQEYVVELLQRIHPDQVKDCLLSYFSTLTEEQLQQKENYLLMRGFMRIPEDNIVFGFLNRYPDIYQGYEKGDDFWVNMYRMMVRAGSANLKNPEKYRSPPLKWFVRQNRVMHRCIWRFWIWNEPCLRKTSNKGMALARKVADKYGDKHPYLYRQFFIHSLLLVFFDDSVTDPELIEQAIGMAGKALSIVLVRRRCFI